MQKLKISALTAVLFCSAFFKSHSQDTICPNKIDLVWLQQNAPDRYQRFIDLENFTANYTPTSGRLINPNGLIIIPVVVHVLHRNEPEGQGFNISLSRIQTQIDILNKDFRRLNADRTNTPSAFLPVASDFNIEFRLACVDPNGNPTNGVVRKYTSKASFIATERADKTVDDALTGIKVNSTGDAAWDPSKYLNIWICNLRFNLGYATWPADYPAYPQFDGIVVTATAFNNITATSGRILTHEIGHWLNLRHLDGDANCGDDFVGDTPAQTSQLNVMGCPSFPRLAERCNTNDVSIMFMNFMSFTSQNCRNLFTNGQRLRTRALFASGVPNGGRLTQLNGFFGFPNQPSLIVCRGSVTVNSMCLPATWTVSGPATIVSGQSSNKLTIQATANGTVHLTATSGNYFAETDIPVTVDPVITGYYTIISDYHFPSMQYTLYENNSPIWLPANKTFGVTAYITNQNPTSPSWTRATNSYPFNWYPYLGTQLNFSGTSGSAAYNERKGIFNFTADIGCGVRTTTFNWPVVVQGWSFSMSASPNPATDNLTVSIVDESAEVKAMSNDEAIIVTLYNLNGTNVVKKWTFKNNQSKFNLNVSDVQLGHYILAVEKGKHKQSQQILIE